MQLSQKHLQRRCLAFYFALLAFGLFAPAAFAFSYLNGAMKKTFLIQLGVSLAFIALVRGFSLVVVGFLPFTLHLLVLE